MKMYFLSFDCCFLTIFIIVNSWRLLHLEKFIRVKILINLSLNYYNNMLSSRIK